MASSSSTKFDYESIVKTYTEQSVVASKLANAKEIARVTYMNKLEEVRLKKLELLAARRRNAELQREADDLIQLKQAASAQVDVYRKKCVETEQKIVEAENKHKQDLEEICNQMKQLYNKYEELDDKFNPENIKKKIEEVRELKEAIKARLIEKKAKYECLQQAYDTFNIEVPNTDKIFREAFGNDVKVCGDTEINKKKLKNVKKAYKQLAAKMNKPPK